MTKTILSYHMHAIACAHIGLFCFFLAKCCCCIPEKSSAFSSSFSKKILHSKGENPPAFVTLLGTRKYPLRGYILGVLTHTTALDRLWGVDETLKCGISNLPRQEYSDLVTGYSDLAFGTLTMWF